jgi:hypothetical protein
MAISRPESRFPFISWLDPDFVIGVFNVTELVLRCQPEAGIRRVLPLVAPQRVYAASVFFSLLLFLFFLQLRILV